MVTRKTRRRFRIGKTVGFAVWMAVVTLFLLWQATSYRGVMSLVGEWQFNAFGRQYPTFNYVLLVFLLCVPGYLLFLRRRESGQTGRPQTDTIRSAHALLKVIVGVLAGLGVVTIGVLIMLLMLPRASGDEQQIDLSRPAIAVPREGPTRITGVILYDRTAGFDEDLVLTRRTFRFAPMIGAGQDPQDLRFFVQFPPAFDERTRAGTSTMTGVLRRNGLPGEIDRLFRYAGFRVEEPHYVLFAEPAAMRWPYLMAMVQFAIAALLVLLLALFQRRRVQRFDKSVHRPAQP